MKKSKKSLNKKPVFIFLYGPIATGKLTVAEILEKKLGYTLTHNHAITDLVDSIFPRGTSENGTVKEYLRNYLTEKAIKAKLNLITTYAYAHDFIYPSGTTEEQFVQGLSKKVKKLGGKFLAIHLKAEKKELLKRVDKSSRKKFGKLRDKKIMRELLETKDWHTSPRLKNNFVIDNTNLSAQKTADIIIKHFKIKK